MRSPVLVFCAGVALAFLLAEVWIWITHANTVNLLNARFESSENNTDLPDYRQNGLLVHTNDGWADVEIHERARQLGFVSLSYIRRDVSRRHRKPIFFDKDFRDIPWMPDELVGSGVILNNDGAYTPLCFYIVDSASSGRNFYGCGGKVAAANPDDPFDFATHFEQYGFEKIPELLDYRSSSQVPFQQIYDESRGIETCSLYGINDSFDYDRRLLSVWHTTCSFAIDKETFDLALGFSSKYMRDYNEFLVKEWSEQTNPVAALFYVASVSGEKVTSADSEHFRKVATKLRRDYFLSSGNLLPVYEMELDHFDKDGSRLLKARWMDNTFMGMLFNL